MARSRRERRRRAPRHDASRRTEEVPVYRDKETGLILQVWGADRGTPERALRDGGWQSSSDRVFALLGPAYARMPGPIEVLLTGGALTGDGRDGLDAIRRRLDAANDLRRYATVAGVQRRMTGQYGLGRGGRDAGAQEPPKVTHARQVITRLAEKMTWRVLGLLLELVLFEHQIPQRPRDDADRSERWLRTFSPVAVMLDLLGDQFRLMPAAAEG